jgi:hypothetical protein
MPCVLRASQYFSLNTEAEGQSDHKLDATAIGFSAWTILDLHGQRGRTDRTRRSSSPERALRHPLGLSDVGLLCAVLDGVVPVA